VCLNFVSICYYLQLVDNNVKMKSLLSAVLVFTAISLTHCVDDIHDVDCAMNANAGGGKHKDSDGTTPFSCYSCLGRDLDNCESGQTCCQTACYKLVDERHSLIAKGCWDKGTDKVKDTPENESARTYKTDVELPWEPKVDNKPQHIKGLAHYCNTKFCNSATRPLALVTSFLAIAFAIFIAGRQ